jgi:hypothetical protein
MSKDKRWRVVKKSFKHFNEPWFNRVQF